jgi:hypothetical protein
MDVLITWIVQMEADRKYNWAVNRVSDPTSYEEGGILAKAGKNDLQILRPYGLEKPTYTIENKDEILDAFSRLVKENTGKINKLLEELESDAVKTDVLRKKIAELGKDIMVLPYSISSMFAEGGTVDYSELQRVLTALKDDPRTVLEENYFNPAEAHNSQLVGKDGKDWRSPVLDTLNKAYNTPISYGMQVSSTNQMNRSNYKRQKDETLAKIERENEEELSVKRSQASHNAKRKQEIEASEKQNQARDKQIAKEGRGKYDYTSGWGSKCRGQAGNDGQ